MEALCHITSQIQYPVMLLIFVLFPYLVIHGLLEHPVVLILSFLPTTEVVISTIVTCFAKVPSSNGAYKSWQSRLLRTGLIPLYFGLKCGTSIFETKAVLEGLFSRDATFVATPKEGSFDKKEKKPFGSANKIKSKNWDDIAALLGILLGVHRLIFMVMGESSYGYIDSSLRMINAFICIALFVVNIGFLVEKYKSAVFYLLPNQKIRRGLPIFIFILCAHSFILSLSLLERQNKINELSLMELNLGSALKRKRGVYFTARDQLFNSTVAFLNSFRHFNPTIPLIFMPHDEVNTLKTRSLANKYDFQIFFNSSLFEEIDQTCHLTGGDNSSQYQKLAMWSGPLDEFLYLDTDTVVLDNIDFVWPLLEQVDVAMAHLGISSDFKENDRQSNLKEGIIDSDILGQDQTDHDGQTGVILSSKRFGSTEGLLEKIKAEVTAIKEHFSSMSTDQPLFHYLFATSGKRYS
eukprot:13193228-Ditylum_brightwellii.AAC.1